MESKLFTLTLQKSMKTPAELLREGHTTMQHFRLLEEKVTKIWHIDCINHSSNKKGNSTANNHFAEYGVIGINQ